MTAALVAALVAVWLGAVVAVSARDPRTTAVGLAVALVAASLLHDPLPSPALLAAQVLGGLLAATLVRTAAPARPEAHAGWPAEALLGMAGAFAGFGLAAGLAAAAVVAGAGPGDVGGGSGPAIGGEGASLLAIASEGGLAAAASGLLLAVALAPAATGRPGPRHAAALVLVVQAVLLFRTAVAGPPVELEVVAFGALLVAAAAAGSVLARLGDSATVGEGARTDAPTGRRA